MTEIWLLFASHVSRPSKYFQQNSTTAFWVILPTDKHKNKNITSFEEVRIQFWEVRYRMTVLWLEYGELFAADSVKYIFKIKFFLWIPFQ